jgi:1-acyl-sn-glycerol-3-phosphate acyltransferase
MLLKTLRTFLWTGPLITLATLIMASLSAIAALFHASGNTLHEMARFWAKLLLQIGFVRVEAEGIEKLDPAKSYVLVSNHTSYFDTPAIIASIPLQFRFFAKKGLFEIPLFGTHLTQAGHFPIVRDDARASLKSLIEGAKQIQERKISVLIFPEGGRSEETLREFKEGAALVAIRAGVPAVPVGITGARGVLPVGSMHVMPGVIRILIGDPIPTGGMGPRERGPLTETLLRRVAELTGEPLPVSLTEPRP